MMQHRGCRLAVSYPEIAAMQTTAIIVGRDPRPEEAPGVEHGPRDYDPPGG